MCGTEEQWFSTLEVVVRSVRITNTRTDRLTFRLFCLVLVLASAAGLLYAQTGRGTIQGVVTDSSGAVVPDARIQLIQIETNSTIDLATNGQGIYIAPNLPYGNYRVVVQKDGFASFKREPITVRAEVTVRVDVALKTGGVAESVVVTAEAPVLDLSTASSATSFAASAVEDLPIISAGSKRNITQLLNNLPGLTSYDPNNKESATWQIRVNGAQTGNSETFVDGGAVTEFGIQRGAVEEVGPTVEMVQEFSVVSNAFNAEYGGFGSWFTNAVIKSGTNTLHGAIYDHLENTALNARSFFQVKKPQSLQNEGGFTLGGPVVLPKIYNGRNRTFFFGTLGLFFTRSGAGQALLTVPTPAFRKGDFSGLVTTGGAMIPIFDPATTVPDGRGGYVREAFPGNIIPENRIGAPAKAIDQYWPTPAIGGTAVNNFYSFGPATGTWSYFNTYNPLIKIDHTISTKQRLSAMYINQVRHRELGMNLTPRLAWGAPQANPLDGINYQVANSWAVRFNHDYVFTPAILNHVTLSADRYINLQPQASNGGGWATRMGLTGLPNDYGGMPAIGFSGGTASPRNLGTGQVDQKWFELRYTVNESLTWTRGKHTMKFGGSHARVAINRRMNTAPSGRFTFTNSMTSQPNAGANYSLWGNSFASFLLGGVNSAQSIIAIMNGSRLRRWGLFAQDDWRITSKLTLSYGLRWDYDPEFFEVARRQTSFEPDLTNPGAGGRLGALAYANSYGRNFQDGWKRGFAPRLGLAYQMNSKTVLRSSAGLYYAASGNLVISDLGYENNILFSSPDGYTPVYNWNTQSFPRSWLPPPVINPSFLNGQAIDYIPRDGTRLPQIASWTLGIQRQVGPGTAIDISYIGSHSTHLAIGQSLSQINAVDQKYRSLGSLLLQPISSPQAVAAGFTEPFPGFANQLGANTVAQSLKPYPQYTSVNRNSARLMDGVASMHSLQLKGTRRLSQGLMLVGYFTWLKSLTNANSGINVYGDDTTQYPLNRRAMIAPDPAAVPFVFGLTWTYELPFGPRKKFGNASNRVGSLILGGWSINGFLRYQSGNALGVPASNTMSALGYSAKYANYVGGSPTLVTNPRDFNPARDRYLNAAAFQVPGTFEFGNLAPVLGWLTGFPAKSEAIQLNKSTRIKEKVSFELGADFANPFNFHRWTNPSTNLASPVTFGVVTGTTPGRVIQLNGKLSF